MILGIDEVGRGPWAGPLVVGAVVLGDAAVEGLTDSKKLTAKRREALDVLIREQAAGYGLGWVSASEIDDIGLSAALRLATIRAVEHITVPYHEIIIDGTINFLKETGKGQFVTTLKKADLLIGSVSAASIIAKVARDRFMAQQDAVYPGYGFGSHVGYGTAAHRAAIERLGVTPLHRLSFAPLMKYRASSASARKKIISPPKQKMRVSTKQIGDTAEGVVAEYLASEGHVIIDRNWKTKYCEIDIVSRLGDTLYFTEVKHRKTTSHGDGLAAVTPKKLGQMTFAAELYILQHGAQAASLRLAVAAVIGKEYTLQEWVEI